MSEPVRVFLVDDHALFRSGVRAELDRSVPDVTVVGEAGSVDEAVAAIRHVKPDVVRGQHRVAGRQRERKAHEVHVVVHDIELVDVLEDPPSVHHLDGDDPGADLTRPCTDG